MLKLREQITPAIVTYMLIAGFFVALWYLTRYAIPPANKDILLILIGALAAKFGDAIAYWLNSTSGSKAKNTLLANMLPPNGENNGNASSSSQ